MEPNLESNLEQRVASHLRRHRSPVMRAYYTRKRMVKDAILLLRLNGFTVQEVPRESEKYGWTVRYPPLNIERRIRSDFELIGYCVTPEPEIITHRIREAEARYGPISEPE